MKKNLTTILLGTFGAMTIAAPAFAATNMSFTPVNVNVNQGQTITLTIGINPQGVKNYTAKTELHYPANLLEVKSFTFVNGWTAVSQPGYDLTDNTNGVLIKTAGYPGGVSSAVIFGTVSFLAKKNGNGNITLNNNSFVFDANNQNVLAGTSAQTVVVISAPVKNVTITPAPAQKVEQVTPVVQEQTTAQQPAVIQPTALQPTTQPLLATIGNAVTLGTNNAAVGVLVIVIILSLAGYAIYAVMQRARRKI